MKIQIIALLIFLFACTNQRNIVLKSPTDSVIIRLIKEKYTEQNKLDGAEFATVDTIYIKNKVMQNTDSSCLIYYHINCSYLPAAAPPERIQQNPPSINTDTSITLQYKGGWIIRE